MSKQKVPSKKAPTIRQRINQIYQSDILENYLSDFFSELPNLNSGEISEILIALSKRSSEL